jgi:catechol 2,3-dioxygenase-like lactoylglutathione lyase family enzyme
MAIRGISHIGLTVSDLDVSRSWYAAVLGWQNANSDGATETTRYSVGRLADGTTLVLRAHRDGVGRFDERTPGLDHLSLAVENAADLDDVLERIRTAGTAWSPVQEVSYGRILNFRDPDNIAIEIVAPR